MAKKRLRMTKTACLRKHAKKRALTRFNMLLLRKDFNTIIKTIHTNKALLLERQSNRVSRWVLEYQGVLMQVVYDRQRRTVVTLMRVNKQIRELYESSKFAKV